jgi:hypothetical protein
VKELVLGLTATAAVGGGVYFGMGSSGYEMSAADARAKLLAADYRVEKGPFALLDAQVSVSSPGANKVQWTVTENDFVRKTCEAVIKPLSESEVEVTASCASPMHDQSGQGKFFAETAQADINEFVDAALTGRAYNPKRKMEAATGSAFKNMGSIMGDAFETKRQVEAMHRDAANSAEGSAASSAQSDAESYDDEVIGEVETPAEYDDFATGAAE